MKYTNLIKLLSVLLCAVMLCTACAAPAEEPPENNGETEAPVPQTPMLEAVEPKLDNFFGISAVNGWRTLGKATRLDGTVVSQSESLLVLRNAKIDHLNNVTETFTVYNTELQTEVLKVENTYEYREFNKPCTCEGDHDYDNESCQYNYSESNYTEFDWDYYYYEDPTLNFPESLIKVEAETYGSYYRGEIPYIKVSRAKITPVDEKTFEENEGNSHIVEVTYDYYDVAGTEILTGAQKDSVRYENENALSFVNVVATFDRDTHKMISKVGADNKIVRYNYDFENEEYGYYLECSQYSALGKEERFFEVYSKEDGALVMRYYLDGDKGNATAFAMAGGDVLVQYIRVVDKDKGEKYNADINGQKVMVESYLVDVPTGTKKAVEPGYYFIEINTAEEFIDKYDVADKGITLTENAANIAIGIDLSSGKVDINNPFDLIVLNNDGSVMFKMDRIIPEHVFRANTSNPFGYTQLPSGDYLVDIVGYESIRDDQATRAIVSAEGKVRAYLTESAKVVGKYVVYDGAVYDYDMKLVLDLAKDNYFFLCAVGNNIIVSKDGQEGTEYYKLVANGDSLTAELLLEDEAISVVEYEADYIVLYTVEDGKYHLYNADLEHVLTTRNEMYIRLCDEKYLVGTQLYVDGQVIDILYSIG